MHDTSRNFDLSSNPGDQEILVQKRAKMLVLREVGGQMAKHKRAPHIARLQAIMDLLGYGEHGGQARFARDIGTTEANFSMIMTGSPLSLKVGLAINEAYPQVDLAFLWRGTSNRANLEFDQRLREWEREHGIRIFLRPSA